MMGARGAAHTGLKFTNMKLDKKYLLGKEGQGMEIAIHPCLFPVLTSLLLTSVCASVCSR